MSANSLKTLLIVESPAKAKTISKILGSKYTVLASFGHIRDLPANNLGIDLDKEYAQRYVIPEKNKKIVSKIKDEANKSKMVLLATDPDREGEAISWHISEILPENVNFKRIIFNAIEEEAIRNAIENSRDINEGLVFAQRARRVLDRLSGYKGSTWLNKFLHARSLSCGRVQSVALKYIVDREKLIRDFQPTNFWQIKTKLKSGKSELESMLYSFDGEKVEYKSEGETKYSIKTAEKAQELVQRIENTTVFLVIDKTQKDLSRKPQAPYTTSTLQQDASTKLGFSVKRTMKIAQDLYEGIGGDKGFITYMRTDSVNIENKALTGIRKYIANNFAECLETTKRVYKSKETSQEAHEAIRPIFIDKRPEDIKDHMSAEHYKLYSLIWKRTLASQMKNAIFNVETIVIKNENKDLEFRLKNTVVKSKGYTTLFKGDESHESGVFVEIGEKFSAEIAESTACTTKPPGRFSEAALVKKMESEGVGRPSTYAPTIEKLNKYVDDTVKSLMPSEKGEKVCDALDKFLPIITSATFTSDMEKDLELIENKNKTFVEVVESFWKKFKELIDVANTNITTSNKELTNKKCPKCESNLYKIPWNNSEFYGCSKYPSCRYSEPVGEKSTKNTEIELSVIAPGFSVDKKCVKCKSDMVVRNGKYGIFLGCSKYPKCKSIVNIPKKTDLVDEFCEKCNQEMAKNKNKVYCYICKQD